MSPHLKHLKNENSEILIKTFMLNTLFREKKKWFTECKVGKLINKERLKIVPHATMSIEAKNLQR
jgi:RNA polymerase-binding transcription factor DksA